jgi:hypothetical protein
MKLEIRITGNAMIKLLEYPEAHMRAIAQGQALATEEVTAKIIPERLTGKGPFPPSEHRLGRVTHQYAMTTSASAPRTAGNTVTTGIGAEVSYVYIHEFGFEGEVEVPAHMRHRAGLSKRARKGAGDIAVRAYRRHMNLAARAPIQTGIAENIGTFVSRINEALQADWRKP